MRGEEYPYRILELDHQDASKDLRGYCQFLRATECLTKRKGNMMRVGDWGWGKGCTLFVFNNALSGALSSSVLNPPQTGEVKILIRFGTNPEVNLTVLLYGIRWIWKSTGNWRQLYCAVRRLQNLSMEKVALNNHQLDYLALADPKLCQIFYWTVSCDRLPAVANQELPTAYIVNTDPHDQLGK